MRRAIHVITFVLASSYGALAAENGLVTKESKHSVGETIERFEAAIKDRSGNWWMVFSRIDHAAAAKAAGLELRPRTVIVFGNPKLGTTPMQVSPTLAVDVPPKALVWQDDSGKVRLTYNSGEYLAAHVYPRHSLRMPPEAGRAIDQLLDQISDQATK
jgi:uncharacterized protein (DUF302 family)